MHTCFFFHTIAENQLANWSKYFGRFCMKLFKTRVYFTNFCVFRISYLGSGSHDEKENQILP